MTPDAIIPTYQRLAARSDRLRDRSLFGRSLLATNVVTLRRFGRQDPTCGRHTIGSCKWAMRMALDLP